jgi:hypothetical protein
LISEYYSLSRLIISIYITTTLLSAATCLSVFNETSNADAQVIDVDEPPTNATEELDVKIDASEPLPLNCTIIVDIAGADDIDIDAIPPEGIAVIVTNTTVTVTNSPVDIEEGGDGSDVASTVTGTAIEENEEELEGSTGNTGNDNSDDEDNTDETEANVGDDEE